MFKKKHTPLNKNIKITEIKTSRKCYLCKAPIENNDQAYLCNISSKLYCELHGKPRTKHSCRYGDYADQQVHADIPVLVKVVGE